MKKIPTILLLSAAVPVFAGQCDSYGYEKKIHIIEAKAELAGKYGNRIKAEKLRAKRQHLMARCSGSHTIEPAARNHTPHK
ncbi:hypothetical protein [Burkholderia sp. KBS0801]|uniref:hypothetical protein n=1 Tax=Burkholderia sp. KBS0801 TaxID=1179675 RepID=UPI00110E6635|nr:hypothetical protein [Burkholderia sp. KBS0801]QDW50007.1 hypothetical protein FFI87_006435 [Burkholderia sp. KBS0801]